MSNSLKDALKNAGFRSTKQENERESAKGRKRKQAEVHQHTRNFCEHCDGTFPDVERYRHHNPTTTAEWICLACADKLMIDDECRKTNQSDMAKRGNFRRYFGHTKVFDKVEKKHTGANRRGSRGVQEGRGRGPRNNDGDQRRDGRRHSHKSSRPKQRRD